MIYYIENKNISLRISQALLDEMQGIAIAAFPNETGGMLAGRISADKQEATIECLVMPTKTESTHISFLRETDGMQQTWDELAKQGCIYIGEWHSHPNGSTQYSHTDFMAMESIVNDNNVSLITPLLFILSVNNNGVSDTATYIYKRHSLIKFKEMINLKEMFAGLQSEMNAALACNRGFIAHQGSKGDATEDKWIDFFRKYLPKRYGVDKAMVIDHEGNVSQQIDIVLYDVFYTPFIFNHDGFKYIPAEGVYAVFEVKQDIKDNIEYAGKKIESVRKLKRTSISMINSGKTMKPRILSPILGGILTSTSTYEKEETIKNHLGELTGIQSLDLCCCADKYSFYVEYDKNFADAENIEINYISDLYATRKVKSVKFNNHSDTSLFTFFLQLVQCLKLIGTVPAIDINAYLETVDESIDMDI